jgi:hypothetical protein
MRSTLSEYYKFSVIYNEIMKYANFVLFHLGLYYLSG